MPTIPPQGLNLKAYLRRIEKNLILEALEQTDWVIQTAADILYIKRTTLRERIKQLGIDYPSPEERKRLRRLKRKNAPIPN